MADYCIGMIGTPAAPETQWSGGKLELLKTYGFNTMQLNIAWGCRPNDEPLNLEDVLVLPDQPPKDRVKAEERRERIRSRLALCKEHGMRSLFHFGAPYNGLDPYQGLPPENCFCDTKIVEKYQHLLEELQIQIPGIDEILMYTYDQDAWLCSEFSNCKNCRGIPLHRRLADFLTVLCRKWTSLNPNGMMWWESWELSAGQVLRVIEKLPETNFGMMIHSNIGEVQKTRPVDSWFRNVCMLAEKRGIPVVAELFLGESSEETEPLTRIPCPELTYTQIKSVMDISGVIGIKEYYGLLPETGDPCLEMTGQIMNHPGQGLKESLEEIAVKYGDFQEDMLDFWKSITQAYKLYPWDVSWYAREVGRSSKDHGWHGAFLRGQQCSTPSWESSRHAVFMKVDDEQPHPWMLEDIQLRCELSAESMSKAIHLGKGLLERLDKKFTEQMQETLDSIDFFRRVCTAYSLHLRETNAAALLREDVKNGADNIHLLFHELNTLLLKDVENQEGKGRVVEIQKAFEKNPLEWLNMYLLPISEDIREKGYFSLTTR